MFFFHAHVSEKGFLLLLEMRYMDVISKSHMVYAD